MTFSVRKSLTSHTRMHTGKKHEVKYLFYFLFNSLGQGLAIKCNLGGIYWVQSDLGYFIATIWQNSIYNI